MKDDLDIFLITYNRKPYLKVTLNRIFEEDSPLRKYNITILDNNSNDGTSELCEEFAKKYSNLTYIKNKINVGLAGNICKAMENAARKYYWIICDNDEIDFTSWPEIEAAMAADYDLIMASVDYRCDKVKDIRSFALSQSTFLPACIYKRKFLTDDVMVYALTDIHTVLPHVCVACNIVNHNGRIFAPKISIISLTSNVKIENLKEYNYDRLETRNTKKLLHERTKQIHFPAGIAASFNALENDKLKKEAIRNFIYKSRINGYGPFIRMLDIYKAQLFGNPKHKMKPYVFKQFRDSITLRDKVIGLLYFLQPIRVYRRNERGVYVRIFGLLKTKIPYLK